MIIAYHISTKPEVMAKVTSVVHRARHLLKCSVEIYTDGWGRTRLDFGGFSVENHEKSIPIIDRMFSHEAR